MGIKKQTSINEAQCSWQTNSHPDKNSKINPCLWTGQVQHNGRKRKRKGRAGLASTYRNNTGTNAENTMG